MPWNGSGVTSRVHNWVNDRDASVDITASRMDADSDDMVSMIQACLAKNGENAATANLGMGAFKHTNVAASSSRTDYLRVAEFQDGKHNYVASDTGSANTYKIAPTPSISSYAAGQRFQFIPANANTGASTINISANGAKTIVMLNGAELYAGALDVDMIADVMYDGTNFILLNPVVFSNALAGLITATAAQINAAATKSDWMTTTFTTPASAGTHTTTFGHGLGSDEIDMSLMLDFTNLSAGTDEPAIRGIAFNAVGESSNWIGRSLAGSFTSADIPLASGVTIKINSGIAKAITVRFTARKR